MTHEYQITGMTCEGCAATVRKALEQVKGVTTAKVDLGGQQAAITMTDRVPLGELQRALGRTKYSIEEIAATPSYSGKIESESKRGVKTYLPIFLIFGYITLVTLIIQLVHGRIDLEEWMRHFMSGFFLTFSFFKMLDIPAFAMSYSSYDIVAKRLRGYGYVYPFIELVLGLTFLIPSAHFVGNIATVAVMGVSIIGVLQAVLSKRKIQCACLGAVFNLPMSSITIIEDALMILMATVSLLLR